jgi:hypothetical protein
LLTKLPASISIDADIDAEIMNIGYHFAIDYAAFNKQAGKYIPSVYKEYCDWALESATRTEGDFIVVEAADSLAIIKYTGKKTELSIPDKIDNLKVVRINASAFRNKGLTKLIIPSSIRSIGAGAFSGNNITQIKVPWGLKINQDALPGSFINAYNKAFTTGGTYRIREHDGESEWFGGWFGLTNGKGGNDWFLGAGCENGLDSFTLGPINNFTFETNLRFGAEIILFTLDIHIYAFGGFGLNYPYVGRYFFGGSGELYLLDNFGVGAGIGMKSSIPLPDILKEGIPNTGGLKTYYHGEIFYKNKRKIGVYGDFYPDSKNWEAGLIFGIW